MQPSGPGRPGPHPVPLGGRLAGQPQDAALQRQLRRGGRGTDGPGGQARAQPGEMSPRSKYSLTDSRSIMLN